MRGDSAVGRFAIYSSRVQFLASGFHVTYVNSALHPSEVDKSTTCFGLRWDSHLCRVAGNTVACEFPVAVKS